MRIFRLLASHPIFLFKLNKSGFDECYQSAIKWRIWKSKTQCLCGFAGPHIHFLLIPTRCRNFNLKQFCLYNIVPDILIILISHIIIAIRWVLIKILSAVINHIREYVAVVLSGLYFYYRHEYLKIQDPFNVSFDLLFLYEGTTHNIKFVLAWKVLFFHWF